MSKDRAVANETMNVLIWLGNGLLALCAWIFTYTGLPFEPIIILAFLLTFDFFAGISSAWQSGEAISSKKMRVGILSKLMLVFLPLLIALVAKSLGAEYEWVITWAINYLILSEFYSIIRHLVIIKTGERLPEWDAVSMLGKKIKKMLEKMVDN